MYMFSLTCESGLGEWGFYADSYCGETPFVFHKEGKNVQVILKNTRFAAEDNSPMGRAVAHSFSDSILGSTKRESQPQDRKSTRLNSSHGYISYAVFRLTRQNHTQSRHLATTWLTSPTG